MTGGLRMCQILDSVCRTRIVRVAVIVFALHALPGCAPETPTSLERFQARPHIVAPPEYLDCAKLVNEHVIRTRALDEEMFKVAYDGTNIQFNAPIFLVSHIDDHRNRPKGELGAGSGLSLFVVVDCKNMEIIKELKMQ